MMLPNKLEQLTYEVLTLRSSNKTLKKELKEMKKRNNDLAAHIIKMAQKVLDEAKGK